MDKNIILKAKEVKTIEELLALAKENGIDLTEEEANTYFAQLNPQSGELSDDELDAVAGGGCGPEEERYCPHCQTRLELYASMHGLNCFYKCKNCGYEEPQGEYDVV